MRGELLSTVEEALSCRRVEEVRFLALHPKVESQGLASKQERPVERLHHRLRHVRAIHQAAALEVEPEVLPRRVVLPVLAHPEPFVELGLPPLVLAPRSSRSHLHHEGGHHALLPQLVDRALVLRDAEHHEDVRGHPGARVALLVVDEEVPGHVDVRPLQIMVVERADRIEDRVKLPVVLRHRLAVPARILNRGGGSNDSAHRKVPPCGAAGTRGPGPRASLDPATITRPYPLPKRRFGAG